MCHVTPSSWREEKLKSTWSLVCHVLNVYIFENVRNIDDWILSLDIKPDNLTVEYYWKKVQSSEENKDIEPEY